MQKSPDTTPQNPTPHQRKPMRRGKLPLLGSNQDSPDPEAVESASTPAFNHSTMGDKGGENTRRGGAVPRHSPRQKPWRWEVPTPFSADLTRPRRSMRLGLRFAILHRDHFTCRYCGRKAPDVELHVDHVLAWSRGGTNHPDNLVSACADCNLGKHTKSVSTTAAHGGAE